jgi:hypothetical protein
MANVDSATLNDNSFMQAFGNAVVAAGSLALTANAAATSVLRILRIPAGTRVSALLIGNTDMDTDGTPEIDVTIGYVPVVAGDGPTAVADYFGVTGQTILGTTNEGKLYCKFAPITFEKDVYLTMTIVTDAETWANGTIYAAVLGSARGIK